MAIASRTQGGRSLWFSVMNHYQPVPFPVHWEYKNTTGVTFNKKRDAAVAQAWIATALLAGYGVCVNRIANRGGGGGVYTLQGGVAP